MVKRKLIILSFFLLSCNYRLTVTHKITQPDRIGGYINDCNWYRVEFESGVLPYKQYLQWIERENKAYDILDSNDILYNK